MESMPFVKKGDQDECRVEVDGKGPLSIEAIMTEVLKDIKKTADTKQGDGVTKAVMTVPAYYSLA